MEFGDKKLEANEDNLKALFAETMPLLDHLKAKYAPNLKFGEICESRECGAKSSAVEIYTGRAPGFVTATYTRVDTTGFYWAKLEGNLLGVEGKLNMEVWYDGVRENSHPKLPFANPTGNYIKITSKK